MFLVGASLIYNQHNNSNERSKIVDQTNSVIDRINLFISLTENNILKEFFNLPKLAEDSFFISLTSLYEENFFNEGAYILTTSDREKYFSRLGMSHFSSLPTHELTSLAKTNPNITHYYIQDETLFSIKKCNQPNENNTSIYIITKTNLQRLYKAIAWQQKTSNPFFIEGKNGDNDKLFANKKYISYDINNDLNLLYQPRSASSIILEPLYKPESLLLGIFWLLTYLSWVVITLKSKAKADQLLARLEEKCKKQFRKFQRLLESFNDVDLASEGQAEFYEELIRNLDPNNTLLLKLQEISSNDTSSDQLKANTVDVIKESIKCVFPLFKKNDIKFTSSLKPLPYTIPLNPLILKLLVINFIYKAVLRTPKNGEITLASGIIDNSLFITITDNGYPANLLPKLTATSTIYDCSENLLLNLASSKGIKLSVSYDKGTNVKLLLNIICSIKDYDKVEETQNGDVSNVVIFPKKN